jgi:hypothetical protein
MENCLVTKCIGVVNNNDLPYVGAVVIDIPALESVDYSKRAVEIRPASGKNLHLKVIGGTFVDSQGTSIGTKMKITDSQSITTFMVSNDDCRVIVNEKYNISYIRDTSDNKTIKDVSFFGYNSLNKTFIFTVNGEVSDLQGTFNTLSCVGGKGSLAKCTINMTSASNVFSFGPSVIELPSFVAGCRGGVAIRNNITGCLDASAFADCNFDSVNLRGSLCYGDIRDIVNSNLSSFNAIGATGLTGSVEACMEKMWDLGVRSRSNMMFSKPENVTLNNITGNQDLKVDISNSGIVVKAYFSEDVLATYNGSTWTYPEE